MIYHRKPTVAVELTIYSTAKYFLRAKRSQYTDRSHLPFGN